MNKTIVVDVGVNWRDQRRIDFDKKKVRKTILAEAREVRKLARRMVARRAISSPGEFPGKDSGLLQKSIKVFPGRKGAMFAVIRPHMISGMEVFYPGILNRGSKRHLGALAAGEGKGKSNRRARQGRVADLAARSASGSYLIQPRANYMEEAMTQRRTAARAAISNAVQNAVTVQK